MVTETERIGWRELAASAVVLVAVAVVTTRRSKAAAADDGSQLVTVSEGIQASGYGSICVVRTKAGYTNLEPSSTRLIRVASCETSLKH